MINRLKIFSYLLLIIFLLSPSKVYPTEKKQIINKKVASFLKGKCSKGDKIGIKILNINTGETLYELNSNNLFKPASNVKLITTATALTRLYPEYKFKTLVSVNGIIKDGIVDGNLYIKGFGDPKLVSEELWIITKDIYNLGIREVRGNIIGDNSFFDKKEIGIGWGVKLNSRAYNAKISALSLNFNTIAIHAAPAEELGLAPVVVADPDTNYVEIHNKAQTVKRARKHDIFISSKALENKDRIEIRGKISIKRKRKTYYRTVSNPQNYFLSVFKEFLEKQGIKVTGFIDAAKQPEDVKIILEHKSRALGDIVRDLNKLSNNFIAEQILKVMGAELVDEPGTTIKGLEIVKGFLAELGISKDSYILVDGSGLSKLNRLSPSQITTVLKYMYNNFSSGSEYVSSLGIVGVDGSVEDRLKNSFAKRKIRAKTGTLNGVICLSGYAKSSSGDMFAFSMLMNNSKCGANRMMKLQDKILLTIVK